MIERPHILVAGGGHNGLVAANYLARKNYRVSLVEARESLGGVVGRTEFMPGYRASVTNSPGSFEGRIIEELALPSYGLRFYKPEVTLLQHGDEQLFIGWRDRKRVADQLEAASPGEAERQRKLVEHLDRLGYASGLSLWTAPKCLDDVLSKMSSKDRKDFTETIVNGSLSELLERSLKSDLAKSLMLMVGLNGNLISPEQPGSAIGLLLRPISRASSRTDVLGIGASPLRGSVGLPIGSMSAIVDALERSALAHGVEITYGDSIEELIIDDDGHVRQACLKSGKVIGPVDHSILTMEPSTLEALLPKGLRLDGLYPPKPTGSAFKLVLALDDLPGLKNAPDGVPLSKLLEAQFRVGPNPEYIHKAVGDGLKGLPSEQPIIWGLIQSLSSPEVAPEGKHLMSLNVWHAPYDLGEDYWQKDKSSFITRILDQMETYFPGLSARIEDLTSYSPFDLEKEFNLSGSNLTHGDMSLEGLLEGRPSLSFVQELSHLGITLGGAGTWPGGYVTGVPGRNAASQVIQKSEVGNYARISR